MGLIEMDFQSMRYLLYISVQKFRTLRQCSLVQRMQQMNGSQPNWDANSKEKQRKAVQQECAD